jgi:DNA-binding NarL/FixJ family response regulator
MPRIRILIAEDVLLVRRLLREQLARDPGFEVVGEAADGMEAVELALRLRPDVVIMDLSMPRLNGAQATEQIAASCPEVRVIILTIHHDLAALGMLSGAVESLTKECTPQELVAAIRRVHARPGREPQDGGESSHQTAVCRSATRAGLSELERRVLERVIDEDLTNQQIAASLSREGDKQLTESAVKHALRRVMTKLRVEPRTRAALVKRVLESGQEPESGLRR